MWFLLFVCAQTHTTCLNKGNIQMQIEWIALPLFTKGMYRYFLYEMEFSVCLFMKHQFTLVEYILTFKYLYTQLYRSFRYLCHLNKCVPLLTWLFVGPSVGQKIQVKKTTEETQQMQQKLQHWATTVPNWDSDNSYKQSSGFESLERWQTYAIPVMPSA